VAVAYKLQISVPDKDTLAERYGVPINDQQYEAITLAVTWYAGWQDRKHRKQVFFLAGFAGTGKTTIAKIITDLCCTMDRAVFIAPTGKAAARLRDKGCPGAKTIHQFIYRLAGEDENGDPIFTDKGVLDEAPLLVVMDESSMVGTYDMDRLMERRLPILALGDTGQVEPVKAAVYFTEDSADFTLTQIERNAGNIVRASMFVREGKRLPPRSYDDVVVTDQNADDSVISSFLGEDSVILCVSNKQREYYNRKARRLLGFNGILPNIGEKVVCTFNQHGYGVMNGEQGIVLEFKDVPEGQEDSDEPENMRLMKLRCLGDGKERWVKFNPDAFTDDFETRKEQQKKVGGFDYGWSLTVHKSQGSEWPRVFLLEGSLPGCSYSKLMYTGITRAIKFLRMQRS
jgi:exodeoxyribonuclease-5